MKCTFGLVRLNAELVFGALDGIDVGGGTEAITKNKQAKQTTTFRTYSITAIMSRSNLPLERLKAGDGLGGDRRPSTTTHNQISSILGQNTVWRLRKSACATTYLVVGQQMRGPC